MRSSWSFGRQRSTILRRLQAKFEQANTKGLLQMILQQSLLYAWKKQFHTVLGLQGVCPCKLSEFFQKSGQVLIKLLAVHAPKPDVILGAVHGEVPRAVDGNGQDARWFVRVRQINREAVDFFPDTAVCLIRAFKQDIAVQNLQKSFLFFCIRVGKRELPLLFEAADATLLRYSNLQYEPFPWC